VLDQHRKINDLHIRKLEAEVSLLQGQIKARDDEDRLHAAKEFHELSVEKTKLEIDSLRLQIAEQRKRIDDWGLGGGG
jgi:cytidylate kinase